jgi:phosphoenolpyruvate synthase/pyruvate phosphate dikinase
MVPKDSSETLNPLLPKSLYLMNIFSLVEKLSKYHSKGMIQQNSEIETLQTAHLYRIQIEFLIAYNKAKSSQNKTHDLHLFQTTYLRGIHSPIW